MIKNKKFKILTISMLCILTITIGLSYGYYLLNKVQDNNNLASSKCFKLELTNEKNNITLDNMYPISDEEGKKLTPYSFTITNTCDMLAGYTVNMEMLEGTTLNSKYLDVMVNNEEIKLLSTYEETDTVINGSTEARIIVKGTLAYNDSVDYTVRFWMDKDVEDTESMNKYFASKIVVVATPSTWNPKDAGYDTLHDAILANEYQTTPEDAIKKIEAKGSPDLSKTAPIIKWQEKIENNINLSEIHLPTQENSNILDKSVYYPFISQSYSFDETTGTYKLINPSIINPLLLDYSSDYYFCDAGYNINSSHYMSTFSHTSCRELKKIVSVETSSYVLTSGNITFNMVKYKINSINFGISEIESDKSDKGLYVTNDDYGKSYYYRGSVSNANVYFANFYWKIIRINGDGSIRLIYNSDMSKEYLSGTYNYGNKPATTGYMYGTSSGDVSNINNILSNGISSNAKKIVDNFYEKYILNKYDKYFVTTGFCGDRSIYIGDGLSLSSQTFYNSYNRLNINKNPILTCPDLEHDLYTVKPANYGNMALTYPIGLITADELAFSGIVYGMLNPLNYLVQKNAYFTMTPYGFDA